VLDIDIDLPEIEDLPDSKASILKSGKISVKNKTQTELKSEYANCVCGLAFYFSGYFFNISPKISTIIVSGYTQRVEKKTGQTNDEYIFSIKIDRTTIERLNFQTIDPIVSFKLFEHQLSLKANFEMKTITPF
jgi:ammonia channel protein AmtB